MLAALLALSLSAAPAAKPQFVEAKGSPFAVGPQANNPVVADLNADGHPDLAVACGACCGQKPDKNAGHVAVLLGDGKGSFTLAGEPTRIGPTALRVAVADLNGDKHLDVACIEHDSYDVTLAFGDGRGNLAKSSSPPITCRAGRHAHTHDIAAADLNADSHVDLAITNADDNTISILLADGKGGFTPSPASPVAAGLHPYTGLRLEDLNNDGRPDIVVPNLKGNAVAVLTGDGKGGFKMAPGAPIQVGERPGFTAVGDLNADGRPDIIATHDDVGMVDVLLADGTGRYTPAPSSPFRLDEPVWGAAIGDIDADGINDVALAGLRGHLYLLRSDGKGNLGPEKVVLKAGDEPTYITIADLNHDTKPDIAASNYKSGDVTVWLAK